MDILLINPFSWTKDGRPPYLPYGVLYLAGYLKKRNVDVGIFDCNSDYSDPVDYVKKCKPKFVGLSVLSGPVIKDAVDISKNIRNYDKNIKIIWGGLHPSLFPKYVLETSFVDYVIEGEGEQGLLEILSGKSDRWNKTGSTGIFVDLNEFWPAWDLVDVKKYISNKLWASKVLSMNTSRGCIFKCHFCFNQGVKFNKWRCVDAITMVDQIRFLKDKYKINGIQFYEDLFDRERDRVREFCSLVKGLDIKWEHFSNVTLADQDLLNMEYESGCRHIAYGVESGSERILKFINKKQNVEQIKKAFEKCRRAKIMASALFMIGLPTETEEDLVLTAKLIKELKSPTPICTVYRPYPSTPLYDWCVKNKGFSEPLSLEEQAEFYAYGKLANYIPNVSEVSTEYLDKLQKKFFNTVLLNEILICLKTLNLERIKYHVKNIFKNQIMAH